MAPEDAVADVVAATGTVADEFADADELIAPAEPLGRALESPVFTVSKVMPAAGGSGEKVMDPSASTQRYSVAALAWQAALTNKAHKRVLFMVMMVTSNLLVRKQGRCPVQV